MEVYNSFKDLIDEDILKSILSIDYFKDEKQKPKVLFRQEDIHSISRRIVDNGYLSQNDAYRYTRIFKDYRYDDAYIVALFNNRQEACTLYHIDFKEDICKKI